METKNKDDLIDQTGSAGPFPVNVSPGEAKKVVWTNTSDPDPPRTGRIVIRKTIESAAGAAADNPANPSLAGFEFQIRDGATQAMVAELVTHMTGLTDTIYVAPGTYEVVEIDSQGLTDHTGQDGPIQGLVKADSTTVVPWTNRQQCCVSPDSLDVAVTVGAPDRVELGQELTFTIVTTNHGPEVARNVLVTDTLPPKVRFVRASDDGKLTRGSVGGEDGRIGDIVQWPMMDSLAE